MDRETFIANVRTLIEEYQKDSQYVQPIIKRQWVSWHFVGYWALSLGLHLSLRHKNIEVHLPFGFVKISLKREAETYYDVSIQV